LIDSLEVTPTSQAAQLGGEIIRIPVGRLATVAIDRGQGMLQSVSPVCEIIGKKIQDCTFFIQFWQVIVSYNILQNKDLYFVRVC